jgi:hypothetical protein
MMFVFLACQAQAFPKVIVPKLTVPKLSSKNEKVKELPTVTLAGTVEAYDYDDNDQPKSLKLLVEIDLENNDEAKKLIQYLDEYVKVSGKLISTPKGQILKVTKLEKVLKDPALDVSDNTPQDKMPQADGK